MKHFHVATSLVIVNERGRNMAAIVERMWYAVYASKDDDDPICWCATGLDAEQVKAALTIAGCVIKAVGLST
jgi:hypothetical protein